MRRPTLLNKKLVSQKPTFLLIVVIFGFLFGLALYRNHLPKLHLKVSKITLALSY